MKKNSINLLSKTNGKSISSEDMKMKVREYIDKLNDSSTRDLAFQNFKILLQTYTDENSVNIIFPLLLSYSNDATTLIGKEYQIILIAFALNINYIKNPSYTVLTKIMKAITCYLGNYNNFEIQKSCSVVIIEIFDQIIKNGETHENALSFIIKFFLEIIEKNRALVSQPKDNGIMNGGYVIISDIISYVISLNSNEKIDINNNENNIKNQAIEQINRKIERDEIEKASTLNSLQKILEETLFNLINKFILFKYPNPYLIESITHLIDVILYDDYKNKIIELIPHTNKVLYNVDAKLYMSKVMICQLYSYLFKKMPNFRKTDKNIENQNNEVNLEENKNNNNNNISELEDEKLISEMVQALNYVAKDRVIKAQVAAEEALIIYNHRNNPQNEEIQNKRKMSKLNLLRNLSKINKEKNNIMSSKEVRKDIYNIGMGKFLRSNDYLNNRDEENLLEIKNELNKSKSKSKEKKDSFNEQRKIGKYKKNKSDINNGGGIMIFQRFDGFKEEPNIKGDNNENNNINKNNDIKNKNEQNKIIQSLKDEDIDLNEDIDTIKNNLLNKNKKEIEENNNIENNENNENSNKINEDNNKINEDNNDIIDKKSNNNENGEDINNKIKENEEINDNFNDKENNNNSNNNINNNNNIKEEINNNENAFIFEEENNNIGDQATIYDKEKKYLNNISEKKDENIYPIKENNNNNNNNNDIINLSNNNDSSNIQGNSIEDINKTNIKLGNDSKKNSSKIIKTDINFKDNNKNDDLLNQLKQNFNDELNKISNKFNEKVMKKLNEFDNRISGISNKIDKIKSNMSILKHTNDLNFKDSKVIIKEENEEQCEKSIEYSIITEKNVDKFNSKSYNILWETISLYLKNEKYDEAYIKALQGGDDIIFLRLIFSIGTWCLPYISVNTNKLILKHFNSIFRTFSIQNKFLEYFESFYNMNMLNVKYFSIEELNDFMQTLYEMKSYKNEVGLKASTLYNCILKDFSSNKNK